MKIERKVLQSVVVLVPEDRFDILGYLDLEEALAEAFSEGSRRVVLDLSRVTFANSSSLAVIARFAREAEILGGTLALASVNRTVEKLLEVIGVRRGIISIYDSAEEAIAASRRHAEEATS